MIRLKILSIDSSAKTASVAVAEDGIIISECFVNAGLTHSRTLLPMVNNTLSQADLSINDIDAFAVNAGPGSFTGIRIGVAAVKGLALPLNKPCCSVSTLESAAYNFTDTDCVVCVAMDARCAQVYTALFKSENGSITRLTDDSAMAISELSELLMNYNETIYLAGDGAEICFAYMKDKKSDIHLASEIRRHQRASGVALAAFNNGGFEDSALLTPVYLRLPQAERELKLKKENSK